MEENKPRGVSLSPKSMVDSVADWPLHQVVEHLRKKEKEDRPSTVFVTCRSVIKSLSDMVREMANRYNISHNRISNWLSYHGVMIARDDATMSKMSSVCSRLRQLSLLTDDTDTLDMMNSILPYSPRIQDSMFYRLSVYDWVASEFEDLAVSCGVPKFRIIQVFMSKSMLSDDMGSVAGMAARLSEEVVRWDSWMEKRLGMLEGLSSTPEK